MSRYGGFKGKFDFKRFKQNFTRLFGSYDNFDETFGYTTFSGIHDLSTTNTFIREGLYSWGLGEELLLRPAITDGYLPADWSQSYSHYSSEVYGNPAAVLSNLEAYSTESSIAKLTIPITGKYTFRIAGASNFVLPNNTNYTGGNGAILRATYTLNQGEVLWLIVGQTNPQQDPLFSRNWQGGAGGTFVCVGSSLATSNPLLVAGGGGALRESFASASATDIDEINGQMQTRGGGGVGGVGTAGGILGNRGAGGGHNQNPVPAGAAAGFYQDGTAHGDNRALPTGYAHAGAQAAINGALGATFLNTYDTLYLGHGGFGGGGPGGWGGMGGAGGYSGGGNGDNGTGEVGGGGGSFIGIHNGDPEDVGTSSGEWTVIDQDSHITPPWTAGFAGYSVYLTSNITSLGFQADDTAGEIRITRVT
jgi:hypothetical protein